jgi:hypothetical protein
MNMNRSNALRLLPICLALTLASCGGGGGDDSSSTPPPAVAPAPAPQVGGLDPQWQQRIYLRTEITSRLLGREYGLSGGNARDLLAVCNNFRIGFYKLPASPAIDPAVLTSLDLRTREQYFDNGQRAATYTAGSLLDLPDLARWQGDLNRNPVVPGSDAPAQGFPVVPPDCTAYRIVPMNEATLWIEGRRYDVDDRKREAVGRAAANDFTPRVVVSQAEVDSWPNELYAGQTCKVAAVDGPSGAVRSCLWDLMPQQKYLNWPWVLRSEATLSSTGGAITDTTRTLELRVNNATTEDYARLRLPDGYTVIERP